jgi:hypothetical protein
MILWAGVSFGAGQSPRVGEETSLPQAAKRITNWAIDGSKGIWVQAASGEWYYGQFLGACVGLRGSDNVAFRFNTNGSLDRFSHVLVRGRPQRVCALKSFVTSAAPPAGRRSIPGAPTPAAQ